MDIFIMQFNYRNRYLVVIDGDVCVCKYEKCKFDQSFISFQPKHILLANQKIVQ